MSWAAERKTKIEEDQAYCLLGIFEVYMPQIYGEGRENAFHRLRVEISTKHMRDAPRFPHALTTKEIDICLLNLGPIDQTRFLSQSLSGSKDACTWVWRNQHYILWHETEDSSLLWITAKAGCGKTILMAHICQAIAGLQRSKAPIYENNTSKAVLLYFFFQKANQETLKTASAALRSIIGQLVDQEPTFLPTLLKRHNLLSAKGDFDWSWENLSSVFAEMLNQKSLVSKFYIILDGLDETQAESRMLIIDWMKGLVRKTLPLTTCQSSKPILKILVTARPDGDMSDALSNFPTLEVSVTDTTNDIRALIQRRIGVFAHHRQLEAETTRKVIQFLETNAQGMFLWVVLVISDLERRNERLSDKVITSKLSNLPLTLADTYSVILHSVPQGRKHDMWRIYRWLLFGSRNLNLAELEAGLCLEVSISRWHGFRGDLNFLCGSLIRIADPLGVVTFAHKTAQDFIEAFLRHPSAVEFEGVEMDLNNAHDHFAALCVQCMLDEDSLFELERLLLRMKQVLAHGDTTQNFLGLSNFLRYAVDSWAVHARTVDKPSGTMSHLVRRLLSSQRRRDAIMAMTYFINKQTCWNVPFNQTSLHIAVYFNIGWVAQMYISEDRSSVHATTDMDDTPLIWASEMGCVECVRLLLDAGADPNRVEADGWSALHWAARNGHVSVAKMLLEHGATLAQLDSGHNTPLDWAINRENHDVVNLLEWWPRRYEVGRPYGEWRNEDLPRRSVSHGTTKNTMLLWDLRP